MLPRLFDFMAAVPPEEHIPFSKLDLADGYWRMVVEDGQKCYFAYVMPGTPGTPTMIVVPRALQMGWNESPAYFCATTETVRDVAQTWIDNGEKLQPHPMETFTKPTKTPRRQSLVGPRAHISTVYVDDHIMAAVEDKAGKLLQRTARATLQAIHSVFPPPSATNSPGAKDPISEKKLHKGDGRWDTQKEILGYMMDGIDRTVQLPTDRADALIKEVRAILRKTRVQLKRFWSIVGRLQHAARILPAARGFFTPLYNALKGLPASIGLGRHGEIRHALLDVANVIQNLASRPTHVNELVQQLLNYAGYCDASAFGASGVWFGANMASAPSVWRVQWPSDITNDVVSDANPNGRLTNSDLELAAVVLQEAVLEACLGPSIAGTQAAIGSDNTPTVAWSTRMASRSGSPIPFRLLRGRAMRQRTNPSAPTAVFHVAGMENILANVASRHVTGIVSHYHMFENNPSAMCPKDFSPISLHRTHCHSNGLGSMSSCLLAFGPT